MTAARQVYARPQGLPAVHPGDADAVIASGAAALTTGSEIAALPLLDAARAYNPGDARLWQLTGHLYRSLDDLAPAVAAFEKAAILAPDDAVFAYQHAQAALEAGLPSVFLFELARCLAPRDGRLLIGLAQAQEAEEGSGAAIELLADAVEQDPDWVEGHACLARLRSAAGQGDRITDTFERALTTNPRNTELWRELIFTSMHADLYDEALGSIRRARQAAGPHPAFDVNEAVCLDEIGKHEAAWRLFESLSHLDDINLLVRRLRNLLRLGRVEQVAGLAEPMLAGPHAPLIAPFLSMAWRMMGDQRWAWLEGDERLVGVYDLAEHLPSLEAFAVRLRALHKASHQPLDQSVRGGTQTSGNNLLSRIEPEIRALRRAIVRAVEQHVAQLPAAEGTHPVLRHNRPALVRFSGSWSIRLSDGGHHINHTHPQGWLSSAFYMSLPPEAQGGSGQGGWLALGAHDGEHNISLPPTRLVEPRPGRLVLFPSTMWHKTRPFAAGERLTIAFDVAPPR